MISKNFFFKITYLNCEQWFLLFSSEDKQLHIKLNVGTFIENSIKILKLHNIINEILFWILNKIILKKSNVLKNI